MKTAFYKIIGQACCILAACLFFSCSSSGDEFLTPQNPEELKTTANATPEYYTVTINKGPGISSVSGAGTYASGSKVTVNATASAGYFVYGWYKNGGLITYSNPYSFTITGNMSLSVESTKTQIVNPGQTTGPGVTTIKGVVIAADDGEPVIGASVYFWGSTNGTITDIDGNFSLQISSYAHNMLVVSYIGYQSQRIQFTAGNYPKNLKITLRPDVGSIWD